MQEIRCPECGKVFQIDESDYSKIVSQVRDAEFTKEMEYRVKHFQKEKEDAVQLAKTDAERSRLEQISQIREDLTGRLNTKDGEIADLKARIQNFELEKSLAVKAAEDAKDEAIRRQEAEIAELRNRQSNWDSEKKLALSEAENRKIEELNTKDREITELKARIEQDVAANRIEQDKLKEHYEY